MTLKIFDEEKARIEIFYNLHNCRNIRLIFGDDSPKVSPIYNPENNEWSLALPYNIDRCIAKLPLEIAVNPFGIDEIELEKNQFFIKDDLETFYFFCYETYQIIKFSETSGWVKAFKYDSDDYQIILGEYARGNIFSLLRLA